MAARALLITGTDTGVGKTFVGCGLAAALRRRGLRVAPFKPAETGCEEEAGKLRPLDALLLREASGTQAALEVICPYRFRTPVAPWVASEREGGAIEPKRLEECFRDLAAAHDWVLVETAGGILVPLAQDFHYGDLARRLELPVLVVAGSRLGVLNQTLLTMEYLNSAGLAAAGCVLNHFDGQTGPAVETNAAALRRLLGRKVYEVAYEAAGGGASGQAAFDEMAGELVAGA